MKGQENRMNILFFFLPNSTFSITVGIWYSFEALISRSPCCASQILNQLSTCWLSHFLHFLKWLHLKMKKLLVVFSMPFTWSEKKKGWVYFSYFSKLLLCYHCWHGFEALISRSPYYGSWNTLSIVNPMTCIFFIFKMTSFKKEKNVSQCCQHCSYEVTRK